MEAERECQAESVTEPALQISDFYLDVHIRRQPHYGSQNDAGTGDADGHLRDGF